MAVENTKQVHEIITKWIEDNTYDDYPADIGFLNFLHSLLCVTELYMEKCKSFEMRPPTIPATGKKGKYYTYGSWHCPRCNAEFPFEYEHKYCPECGQRIDWTNKRFAELLGRIPPAKKMKNYQQLSLSAVIEKKANEHFEKKNRQGIGQKDEKLP